MRTLFLLLAFLPSLVQANKEDYCRKYGVCYGNSELKVRQYVSFACSHCQVFFKERFPKVHSELIETGRLSWEFVPYPIDLRTLEAMFCLDKLGSKEEKKTFFGALFPFSLELSDEELSYAFQKSLRMLGVDAFDADRETLRDSKATQAAFDFRKQCELEVLPAFELNGQIFEGLPSESELFTVVENYERSGLQ